MIHKNDNAQGDKQLLKEKEEKEIKKLLKKEQPKKKDSSQGGIPKDPSVPPTPSENPRPDDGQLPQGLKKHPPVVEGKPDSKTNNAPDDKWDPNDPIKM